MLSRRGGNIGEFDSEYCPRVATANSAIKRVALQKKRAKKITIFKKKFSYKRLILHCVKRRKTNRDLDLDWTMLNVF